MIININKLKEAGVTVRLFERNGGAKDDMPRPIKTFDAFVEVFFEGGRPLPVEVADGIRDLLPEEYGDGVVETLANRICNIQLMEAISKTGRDRK